MNVGKGNADLEILTPDGRKITARLEASDYTSIGGAFPSTHDPRWILSNTPDQQEWLGYMGGDRKWWWSRVKASYDGRLNIIKFWFDHRGPGIPAPGQTPEDLSASCPNHDSGQMGFFDWNNSEWHAGVEMAHAQHPPTFELKQP